MAAQEIVRLLRDYVQDDGETIERRDGPAAVTLAEAMRDVLTVHLKEESPYSGLWEAFKADPQATSAELIGALEALFEAEPGLARRLEGFMERYHRLVGPAGASAVRSARHDVIAAGNPLETTVTVDDTSVDVPHEENAPEDAEISGGTYLYGNMEAGSDSTPTS